MIVATERTERFIGKIRKGALHDGINGLCLFFGEAKFLRYARHGCLNIEAGVGQDVRPAEKNLIRWDEFATGLGVFQRDRIRLLFCKPCLFGSEVMTALVYAPSGRHLPKVLDCAGNRGLQVIPAASYPDRDSLVGEIPNGPV